MGPNVSPCPGAPEIRVKTAASPQSPIGFENLEPVYDKDLQAW